MSHYSKHRCHPHFLRILIFGTLALASCQLSAVERSAPSPTPHPSLTPTSATDPIEFTQAEIDSLNSLQKVDEHPLFVMHYQGPFRETTNAAPAADDLQRSNTEDRNLPPPWACSLFATLADPQSGVFGRNFDWEFSPALLLFTDPPDGYASVSMVDLAYLFDASSVAHLMELDLNERKPLLNAPVMPFDGLNERGLAIGMAAVPHSPTPNDPNNESVDSLRIMRMILDHAASVEEALPIMRSVNILWNNGPPLHYLLADANGTAALVEFVAGEMVVHYNANPWHQATNFLLSNTSGSADGICTRYDLLTKRLQEEQGDLSLGEAMKLLADVSQSSTQWSVVYQLHTGRISLAMGSSYSEVHAFQLETPALGD
ncbi:MAG: linear amide C-N hydrolase [Anaerolineales bacterium]|nr:linear amide C-N hydrolase [Anaerolineales bacterium]